MQSSVFGDTDSMKPQFIKLNAPKQRSFNVIEYNCPHFAATWQYHPEFELKLVLESTGKQFIGDSIEDFEAGNLVLIGSNLPHRCKNDDQYYDKDSQLRARAIVLHFSKDFAGEDFLQLPEMHNVQELFYKAQRGIKITGGEKSSIINMIEEIPQLSGTEKLASFLTILGTIATETNHECLSTVGFVDALEEANDPRLNKVFEYIMNNFSEPISLDEISRVANMTRTSFCRYFKKHTRKTFTQFLNKIRIGYACKLLQENKLTITQICFTCGFNNLSHFNCQFKDIKQQTPSEYQSNYLNF